MGAGALDEEISQQRYGPARAALLRAGNPGCSRDIQVRPLHALGEAAQEGAGRDSAAVAAAHIGQIRKIAAQLFRVVRSVF